MTKKRPNSPTEIQMISFPLFANPLPKPYVAPLPLTPPASAVFSPAMPSSPDSLRRLLSQRPLFSSHHRWVCRLPFDPVARSLILRVLLPSHDSLNLSGGGVSGSIACASPSAPCHRGSRPELKPADAPPCSALPGAAAVGSFNPCRREQRGLCWLASQG
jgi:hypothetical protein